MFRKKSKSITLISHKINCSSLFERVDNENSGKNCYLRGLMKVTSDTRVFTFSYVHELFLATLIYFNHNIASLFTFNRNSNISQR